MVTLALRLARHPFVQRGFVVLALGLGALALAGRWSDARDEAAAIGWPAAMAAAVIGVAGIAVGALNWRAGLASVGAAVPVAAAARIYAASLVGKYVPGAVWPSVIQARLAQRFGLSARHTVAGSVVAMLLSAGVGLACGAVLSAAGGAEVAPGWLIAAGSGAGVLLLLLNPAIRQRVRQLAGTAAEPLVSLGSRRPAVAAALWALAGWLVLGLHLYVLVAALDGGGGGLLMRSVGAMALAWSAGFLFVIAPAGAGVREAVLVAALRGDIGVTGALTVALVSRLLLTAGDLVLAAAALALSRRTLDAPPGAQP
jgi:hypothetical protein